MNNRKYGYTIIDNQTGEVIGDSVILFFGKPKCKFDKDFVKVYPAFLSSIVETEEIAGKSIRLIFYIMERLDLNNPYVHLFHKEVCRNLKISTKTFYNWLKVLIKHDIVKPTHIPFLYQINYYHFAKGSKNEIINNEMNKLDKKVKQLGKLKDYRLSENDNKIYR